MRKLILLSLISLIINSCTSKNEKETITISKNKYQNQLYGFWLGQCIANWTGLVTEMDKIGNIGDIKTGDFYTRDDWGKPDQPSIWGEGVPSDLSPTIGFVFRNNGEVWGADDDTDIEFMYQHLLYSNKVNYLTPKQIQSGWLKHIKPEEENYLWVSNQKAFDLMKTGVLPPETGNPELNEHYDMIDAQLTTEIFGLFAPTRPDIAIKIAELPIQTTARKEAEDISKFYVSMYSLVYAANSKKSTKEKIFWMSHKSREILPNHSYPAKIYDYTYSLYKSGINWEQTRDSLYNRYQVEQKDGYNITSRNLYCNGCFAAGINFAASLVSLFYGEGDLKETIKIGTLAGWDSDNPTATWGGLIGFMIGKDGIESTFNRKFSNRFNIHRTRQNFSENGITTFEEMSKKGLEITNKIILEELGGKVDEDKNSWIIPLKY
ncbi:MAG: ADP-ribosylglycohydrolase family protein [Polaribacter sp.]|nr:ADP-ribosylglycohydrolase family protein [Polaribacter sp.]